VVFSPVKDGVVSMTARADYGRLRIRPGGEAATEVFALGWFADARIGLENYADAVADVYQIHLPEPPVGLCTWYMEKNSGACNERALPALCEAAARELRPFGVERVRYFDDGRIAPVVMTP
jgi:hypothetical protein